MLSCFLFFVVWVLIGKFVLLSLFLAVILEVCSHSAVSCIVAFEGTICLPLYMY